MRLESALRISRGDVIAFIGAGGKSSALFQLGHELRTRGWRVLATTTTRMAASEVSAVPLAMRFDATTGYEPIRAALNRHGFVFLYDHVHAGKTIGVPLDAIRTLMDRVDSDVLLIEADGSRQLPLKAPYDHEPVIPAETSQVVLVAGMNVIGQPLNDAHVYNAEAMIARYGFSEDAPVMWPWVASVLRDEQLGLRNIDPDLPVSVILNQTAQQGISLRRARLVANLLLKSPRIRAVAIGEVQSTASPVHEVRRPVAAIVLAAGMSRRMGTFKVLLPWGNEPVLSAILRRLNMVRMDEVVVVTGREAETVAQVSKRLGARSVFNPAYQRGEMLSSLQVGLRALDDRYDACLVVLGDQPQIQGRVVAQVLNRYAETQASIVAPSFQRRRGHPILIGRQHWPALLELPDEGSPRDVINAHQDEIAYVNVNTDSILADIDTPEQYRAALRRAGLR